MLIIGISGGTGSGKTTVVNQIVKHLPTDEVCVISQDSYYKATDDLSYEQRTKINFDHPRAIDFDLIVEHLIALKEGHIIEQPVYSFVSHNRTIDTVKTHPLRMMSTAPHMLSKSHVLCDKAIFDFAHTYEARSGSSRRRRGATAGSWLYATSL